MSAMFSNGTEGDAWMAVWCDVCANIKGCDAIGAIYSGITPECITLERDGLHLPALHVCSRFAPDGEDEYAEVRERVVAVTVRRES